MTWEVAYTRRARQDLGALDRTVVARVLAALDRLAEDSPQGDVVRLAGDDPPAEFRLRVGDWRVLFDRDEAAGVILVQRIAHRREAYRS